MAQNVYDDPEFFRAYAELPRSVSGLDGAAEWPSIRGMLPPLAGRRVVDLGCGYGWFCRWAAGEGAAHVLGVDLSEKMLARAAADTPPGLGAGRIAYARHDLETITLSGETFDLAYSSLTLHYVVDLDRLVREVHGALAPGGAFVFSVEHPIYTAPASPDWVVDAAGHETWPLDGYLREGPRTTDWLAPGVVKQHRTVATYVSALLAAGLVLTDLCEWGPSAQQITDHPEWARENDRPPFLLVAARRA
jgi:SAM-dependent methyltransferase